MKTLILSALAFTVVVATGCDRAEIQQERKTDQAIEQANQTLGMPAVTKFTERRLLKQIYELRDDEKLICYAYLEGLDGKLHFMTKCLGYGIPYATQYSNPTQLSGRPQAEPNGLYMPNQAEGTWLMVPDPKGNPHPVYVEPRVVVSPLKIATAMENPSD